MFPERDEMLVLLVRLSSNREPDTRVLVFPVAVAKERGEAVLAVFSKVEILFEKPTPPIGFRNAIFERRRTL